MSTTSLAQRVIRAVSESPVSERVADVQATFYGPVLERLRTSPFHTDALGHSVHPPLTDVTLGTWLSASVLDVAGGPGARPGAALLVGAGLAASVPTAFSGAADWTELSGEERRIGAIHSLSTDLGTFLFVGSLIARLRGRHSAAVKLGLAGNLVMAGAGFLGGHLALSRGTARRA